MKTATGKSQLEFLKQVESLASRFSNRRCFDLQQQVFDHVLLNSPRINSPNFESISAADIGLLFHVTDELFFDGRVSRFVEKHYERPLSFRLSTRMTTSGGTTTMFTRGKSRRKNDFEIAIATTPLFGTFKIDSEARVGGVVCPSRLHALQRIVEHELIHLVELVATDDSNCQAARFRRLVRQFFGHLESNHQLMTPRDVARKKLGIRCGDEVIFCLGGESRRGIVNRITKRATVLVKDPAGTRYTDGQRYSKYYIPLPRLKRA